MTGAAFGDLVLLADPPPQVGVDIVRLLDRRNYVLSDRQRAARCLAVFLRNLPPPGRWLVLLGRRMHKVHPQPGADVHERAKHVGGITHKGHAQVL